jgi:3-methyladenine DNA glycosylase AlkD
MKSEEIIDLLKMHANPKNVEGMARFGISTKNALGVNMPLLKSIAKEIGKDHELALDQWETEIHEARIVAPMIDIPKMVSEAQMEKWVHDFDSWDVCDQVCNKLFDRVPIAYKKGYEWCDREEEFVKRAGFVLIATLSVHDKKADDEPFYDFFEYIIRECRDERNFVRKAVNWALRQIGKRNIDLNSAAIETCERILESHSDSKAARWIARDAMRELTSEKIYFRLKR